MSISASNDGDGALLVDGASLLHVPNAEIVATIHALLAVARDNGVIAVGTHVVAIAARFDARTPATLPATSADDGFARAVAAYEASRECGHSR